MKKIYFLIGALLSAGAIQAQGPQLTPTYDFHPDVKHAPGAISYIPMRDVDQNQDRTSFYLEDFDAGMGVWTNAIQTGTVGFALTSTGHINSAGNTFVIPTLMTSTPTQWVLLDSDGLNNSYSNPEASTFTSAVIDLSATTGSFVALEFDQFFAEWQPAETEDHCFLGVSIDGTNWTEVEINEGVGREARPNPERVSWDISDDIAGNLATVQFRFRWEGAWNYGWQIDNIEVVDIPEKDIAIIDTWRGYSDRGLTYSQVPIAQKDTIVIGAIIRNIGHIDQTNVTFSYVVKDPSLATVASGTCTDVLSLTNAEQDSLLWSTDYVPTAVGTYTIEWTVTSTEGDDVAANDVATDAFYEITDYTYAMDYNEGAVAEIAGWPLLTGEAYFGSLFDFNTADVISGIDFKLTSNASNVGEEVLAAIYYFPTGGTDWLLAWDLSIPMTVATADLGEWISIPVDGGLNVNTTDLYMVVVGQYANAAAPLFEKQGDIGWNNIQGRDEDGANRGFFDRLAPLVRARVNAAELGIEDEQIADRFSIYPNPANELINVSVSLTNSENTVINVVDITGKVITTMNLGTVNGDKNVSISLDNLSTGVYFVEMVNATSKQVKKFVKK